MTTNWAETQSHIHPCPGRIQLLVIAENLIPRQTEIRDGRGLPKQIVRAPTLAPNVIVTKPRVPLFLLICLFLYAHESQARDFVEFSLYIHTGFIS